MRVRTEHWQLLLQCCEGNPELITNKFNGVQGKVKGNALWSNVATKLNSLGYGEKPVEGWRKALTDWKSKTKSKAAAIKRELLKTGGGANELPPLSNLEEKLLAIMGPKSVVGDEDVPEIGFGNVEMQTKVVRFTKSEEQAPRAVLPTIKNKTDTFNSTFNNTSSVQNKPYNQNHDYGQPSGIENDCFESNEDEQEEMRTVKKRKLASAPKSIRRRPEQNLRLSNELLQLNRESMEVLKTLRDNTEMIAKNTLTIAESLKIMASVMQQHLNS